MKKSLLLFFALIFCLLSVSAQKTILNDPDAAARSVSGFHAVKVSNAFDVYLTQGNEDGLAVSASKPEYREKIKTVVENGILKVSFEDGKKIWKGWKGDRLKLRVYISFKKLDQLNASGACNIHFLTPVKGDELTIDLSGATDMKNAEIRANKLNIEISGASDMNIVGSANQLKVQASGASDFKSLDFEADYCDADASGASSILITVNKEISAKASGASDVRYKGNGVIRDIKTSGASKVSRKS